MKKMTLLEFNEVSFDLVKSYISDGMLLPNFERLIEMGLKESVSETEYHLIEPWIQWPSVHTGLNATEHGLFRLGDIVDYEGEQIFEYLLGLGFKVGCISPMNASNRHGKYSFFVPDPWTQTLADNSWQSRAVHGAISKAVNSNSSGKLDKKVLSKLALALIATLPFKSLLELFRKLPKLKSKGFKRAIFLDNLLTEIYVTLAKKHDIHFGTLFLNGLAHVQHHYFHSCPYSGSSVKNPTWYSSGDPIGFTLKYYDQMLGKILDLNGFETLVATGLSQVPYENPVYYYRLKDHETFVKKLGINFSQIHPRMTRDFLISFDNNKERDFAAKTLTGIKLNSNSLFGQIEKRNKELFVVLDYPYEIKHDCKVSVAEKPSTIRMLEEVNFVALKNGHHSNKGYVLASDWQRFKFNDGNHVKDLNRTIKYFFNGS